MARISKPTRICLILSAVALLFLALLCVIGIFTFNYLFTYMISKKLAIIPGNEVYDNWLSPSVPVYFSVYLYNLTNPEEVLNGDRPKFSEVGPYVYREDRQRIKVNFSEESPPKQVEFRHRIFYYFEPELSVGPDDEGLITSLDLVTVGANALPSAYKSISIFYTFTPFVTRSPREIMWGYEDSFLKFCTSINFCESSLGGMMAQKNGTKFFDLVVDTGVDDISNVGKVLKYNGLTELDYWRTTHANMINGTDGSTIAPGLNMSSRIYFFVPDFCRSFYSDAAGWATAKHDSSVHLIRFSSPREQSLNATLNPLNKAFCPKVKAGPDCPPTGMIPLSPCSNPKIAVPIFASQPHFLGADPHIREAMDGIRKPNESLDSTVLLIEPTTGFILEAYKKVQINVYVENDGDLGEVYRSMRGPYFFPLAWFTEYAVADEKALKKISNYILKPKKVIPIVLATVASLALVSAIILIVVLLTRYDRKKTDTSSVHAQSGSGFLPASTTYHDKTGDSPFDQWTIKPSPEHDANQDNVIDCLEFSPNKIPSTLFKPVTESRPLLKPSDSAGKAVA
uniref:Lysosome membrane protein 2 n=1 Tax=Trichobilharzia regenti TaxID=157069 RepID=A0AA85ISU7_TRIRE|nr:unnamed protein product [Trichobilharzia regenti]